MENQNSVFEVSPENFQADVIEKSQQMPIVVLFWADQVGPSVQARGMLEAQVNQHPGKVALALVDVARDQTLAQHLRVQGLPSLRVVRDGQLVDQLEGPQTDAAITELIDQLTLSSADVIKSQLRQLLDRGDFATALDMLQQAVTEEPKNMSFRVELADVLVLQQMFDDAEQVLNSIPEDAEERDRPANRLEISREAQSLGDPESIVQAYDQDPEDLELCYQLALHEAAGGNFERALELAMSILQRDRTFRDDIGRVTMIRIFAVLGKGSELATGFRRRMFNFMH